MAIDLKSIEEEVIEEIKIVNGINYHVTPDHKVFHDLWLYGDDADEVLDSLSDKYGIEEAEFIGSDYWPDEEPYLLLARWFYPEYIHKWKPMTVRELSTHAYNAIMKIQNRQNDKPPCP